MSPSCACHSLDVLRCPSCWYVGAAVCRHPAGSPTLHCIQRSPCEIALTMAMGLICIPSLQGLVWFCVSQALPYCTVSTPCTLAHRVANLCHTGRFNIPMAYPTKSLLALPLQLGLPRRLVLPVKEFITGTCFLENSTAYAPLSY